ncbi:copper resistance CopC family protein [Pseudonocardia sp. CA-107938]|uniref:copper resistance CopC family protein n=1 Tax=Pseudonocardia sp. CA-107938 TaxID=3240021 RepID=UPI003D91F72E
MRRLLQGGVLAVVCGLVMLLVAGPAAAHSRLESSDPADGASLATPPSKVTLTFNEQMQQGFATITVIGPGGTAWQDGETQVSGDSVSIAVKPLGPAGVYQIGYRVISDDGHPVSGSVSFTLTSPGPGAASAAPTVAPTSAAAPAATTAAAPVAAAPAGDGGAPVWPWIVGAVVAVGLGVVLALRLGRS